MLGQVIIQPKTAVEANGLGACTGAFAPSPLGVMNPEAGCTHKPKEVSFIDSVNPGRVGTIMVSLLNVLQDAPGSRADKAAAVSCLFREVVELCRTRGSLRASVTAFLEFAENLSTEQVTGLPKPEFRACHEFVKNELAKAMQQ